MSRRTPLGRVLGLGSAKEGASHWWMQRLTAMALLPLGLWFAASLLFARPWAYAEIVAWLGAPLNTILAVLLVLSLVYHSLLGVQVVIEDYVHHGPLKLSALVLSMFAHVALGAASIYAILRVAFTAVPAAGVAG